MQLLTKSSDSLVPHIAENAQASAQAVLEELIQSALSQRELTVDLARLTALDIFEKIDQSLNLREAFFALDQVEEEDAILPDIETMPIFVEESNKKLTLLEKVSSTPSTKKVAKILVIPEPQVTVIRRMPLQNKRTIHFKAFEDSLKTIQVPAITWKMPRYRKQALKMMDIEMEELSLKDLKKKPRKKETQPRKTRKPKKKQPVNVFEDLDETETLATCLKVKKENSEHDEGTYFEDNKCLFQSTKIANKKALKRKGSATSMELVSLEKRIKQEEGKWNFPDDFDDNFVPCAVDEDISPEPYDVENPFLDLIAKTEEEIKIENDTGIDVVKSKKQRSKKIFRQGSRKSPRFN